MNEEINEWSNERMIVHPSMNHWANQWVDQWVGQWVHESMKECRNEWTIGLKWNELSWIELSWNWLELNRHEMKWIEKNSESLTQWVSGSTNQSVNEWTSEWISEGVSQWKRMKEWTTHGWVSYIPRIDIRWYKLFLCWATTTQCSLSYFFSELPLFWATSPLTGFCSDLPPSVSFFPELVTHFSSRSQYTAFNTFQIQSRTAEGWHYAQKLPFSQPLQCGWQAPAAISRGRRVAASLTLLHAAVPMRFVTVGCKPA